MTDLLRHLLSFGWQITADEARCWILKKEGYNGILKLEKPKKEWTR